MKFRLQHSIVFPPGFHSRGASDYKLAPFCERIMVSDDESGILGSIPGAWVSDDSESQFDLDLSLPHFTKPCSPPASFLLNSQAGRFAVPHPATPGLYPPRSPTKSMPSKASMSNLDRVVRFHRRLSNSLFSSQDVTPRPPTGRGKTSKVTKKQMESTPQVTFIHIFHRLSFSFLFVHELFYYNQDSSIPVGR